MIGFTEHAVQRIAERTSLTLGEVYAILNEGKYIPIGCELGTTRMHKVFYSALDKQCFAAVQDEKTEEVVTILPMDYHNAWRVHEDVYLLARNLIHPPVVLVPPPLPAPPNNWKIRVYLWREGSIHIQGLGSYLSTLSIAELLQREAFLDTLRKMVQDKSIHPDDVESFFALPHKNGPVTTIEKTKVYP